MLARRDAKASTSLWAESDLYPEYFQHTFHYQKDGWFSTESAKVYEASTETLFVGRQDAMQRGTLVPFSRFMQGARSSPPSSFFQHLTEKKKLKLKKKLFVSVSKRNHTAKTKMTDQDLSVCYHRR